MSPLAPIWIIGAGRFGRRAIQVISGLHGPNHLLVVDSDPSALVQVPDPGILKVQAEATEFLLANLTQEQGPRWIIPCVPFHLAWRWLLARLSPQARVFSLPTEIMIDLPNPFPAEKGGFYISLADFTCPPDCPEPAEFCTFTQLPRVNRLYQHLAQMDWPGLAAIVLRSHQLAPGVGGFRPQDLYRLENLARRASRPVLIATACSCHGVIHGLDMR